MDSRAISRMMNRHGIPCRDSIIMRPTKVLIWDPYPFGLTVAHMILELGRNKHSDAHGRQEAAKNQVHLTRTPP